MQHHQRSGNGRYIYRKHDRSILHKTQTKVIRRDDIHKIRDNEWQTGGIRNKPRGHHKGQRCLFAEPQRKQHNYHYRCQDQRHAIVGK